MATELQLALATYGSVVAPAGYAKTELIVKAAALCEGERSLVLTHTHAGVNALNERMKKLGVVP